MSARLALVLAAFVLALPPQPSAGGRVFLLSLDGLGYQRLTEDPVVAEAPALTGLLAAGAHAEGLSPAFPASTANSHAALWTGTYAGRNGILYNATPRLPRSAHASTERVSGYRSESLTAEPIWLAAARQGVSVVAHQVTQVVPFLPQTVGERPLPDLVAVNGFQSRMFAHWRIVRRAGTDVPADVRAVPCDGLGAPARGASACVAWSLGANAGNLELRAALHADRLVIIAPGGAAVDVPRHATETMAPKGRALARYWSAALPIQGLPGDAPASLAFRLFELDAGRGTFLLAQSPLSETAVASTDAALARELVAATGPMVGNGAGEAYTAGDLGAPAYAGGDGEAERRYLETLELVVRQQIAQSTWLFRTRQPRLHISYLSTADEVDHAWYGLDRAGVRPFRELRRWGYAALERAVEAFTALATAADHVVIVSDHGMTAVARIIDTDALLAHAGLRATASAVYSCVVLNTTDWKGGTIAPAERDAAAARVRDALLALRGPDGAPLVARVYATRAEMAALGHDGPGGADECFDPVPGVGVGTAKDSAVLTTLDPPRGAHGLDPARADMQAILLVKGPRVTPGASFGPRRSQVVAPLVADLLGIQPPRQATGASPLAAPPR